MNFLVWLSVCVLLILGSALLGLLIWWLGNKLEDKIYERRDGNE